MERGHSVDYMQRLLSPEYTRNILYPVELNCALEGISPDKSTSVYECFPFIWPYNALLVEAVVVVPQSASRKCAVRQEFRLRSDLLEADF